MLRSTLIPLLISIVHFFTRYTGERKRKRESANKGTTIVKNANKTVMSFFSKMFY
jgi:hypothetical protein